MRRALELARLGLGSVSPNPLVGCVIVAGDRVIGEGWHQVFGGPHAEVNALANVEETSRIPGSTVFVNLEPCSHFGKTPPCADLLVDRHVARVVIGCRDPNPRVAGEGIAKLRKAGIEVTEGVLQDEGRWLNRRFFTNMEQGIPYLILKWAESDDGYMAASDRRKIWISHTLSRQRVHQWRAEEDAVMVGRRTAEMDNPRLNVRDWTGRNPARVVLDPSSRLPGDLHLFDSTQITLCYNRKTSETKGRTTWVRIADQDMIPAVMKDLLAKKIGSVIVEGGADTLHAFIAGGWWHEARIFRSTMKLGDGQPAPRVQGDKMSEQQVGQDTLSVWTNPECIRTGPRG